MPLICSECSDESARGWVCLTCFDGFCGTKSGGHISMHCAGVRHPIALNMVTKQFWCFDCKSSTIHPGDDARVQIAFGLCMSSSSTEWCDIGALLLRIFRRGHPNPTSWEQLPLHRRAVFGSRPDVSLSCLAKLWANSSSLENPVRPSIGRKVIIMAGAGISCKAGIPDFRSPGTGLYSNLANYNLTRPEDMFSLPFFRKDPLPFYDFAKSIWPTGQHKPTKAHLFMRLLEQQGRLHRVYTQNIDGLEHLAGVSADKLVESHGSFSSARCIDCNTSADITKVKEAIFSNRVPVLCDSCSGFVKPDITFFGEMLPNRFHELSPSDFEQCDLLIILGTSLKVAPFNSLPSQVEDTVPRLLINRDPVHGTGFEPLIFDGPCAYRDIFLPGDCDGNICNLVQLLGMESEFESLSQNKVDMRKPSRPIAPKTVPECEIGLPPVQRLPVATRELDDSRSLARMDIHAAIFHSDVEMLKSAVKRGHAAGLSYWEIAAANEILHHRDHA